MQGSIKIDLDVYGNPFIKIEVSYSSQDVRDKLIANFVWHAENDGILLENDGAKAEGVGVIRIVPKLPHAKPTVMLSPDPQCNVTLH